MRTILAAAGLFLALIWAGVTVISLGVPEAVCVSINNITPDFLHEAVGNMRNGFYYDVANKDMPTAAFLALFTGAFWLYFPAVEIVRRGSGGRGVFGVIIGFSILFRLILLPGYPVHENDIYRYLWDGKVSRSGINAFSYAPGDLESLETGWGRDVYDEERHTVIRSKSFTEKERADLARLEGLRRGNPVYFDRIGHRRVPTIYPPAAQALFAVSSMTGGDSITVMKGIFVLFDILALILIAALLAHFGKDPALCIVYGWSPLVLKEAANSGHYDPAAVFLMLLAVYAFVKGRRRAGAFGLALAGLSKFFPLSLAAVYAKRLRPAGLAFIGLITGLVYLPFFLWDGAGFHRVFAGLGVYSREWAYNGAVFSLLRSILDAAGYTAMDTGLLAKIVMASIFAAALICLAVRRHGDDYELLRRSFFVMALLFLLSPVGDPWYFLWVMPFLCFFIYRSFILLSWLLIFSYLSFINDTGMIAAGGFSINGLVVLQYAPFFAVLAAELLWMRYRGGAGVSRA